ncbi:MAG: response regulator [Emcibacter sp.]|nr:response regulator [Emcibacter sp.]
MNILEKRKLAEQDIYFSLWQQILCVLCLFGIIIGGGAIYSSSLYEEKYAQEQLMRQNKRVLSFISAGSMEAVISEDIPVLETLVSMVMATDPDIIHIRILNENNQVLTEKFTANVGAVANKIKFQNDIEFEGEKFGTIELYWDVVSFFNQINQQTKHVMILAALIVQILIISFLITIKIIFITPITRINHKLLQMTLDYQNPPLTISKYTAIEFQNLAESVNSLQQSLIHREQILSDLEISKDKAEASSEAKSKFLAVISHEIRTPINGIMGMSEILKDADLTKEEARHLNLIEHSAKDLMEIVNDILDFSSIEKNKFNLNEISFPLDDLINELTEYFTLEARTKSLSFNIKTQDFPKCEIKGDSLHLKQALINLLSNAFKFTQKGEITLEVSCYPDSDPDGMLNITFKVTDTGIGISSNDQKKIFDEFKQLNEGFNRRYPGLGLGLALSQRIIKKMGGVISVKSKLNQGSQFSFTLPFQFNKMNKITPPKQATKTQSTTKIIAPKGKNKKQHILLVEDSITNQEVILAMLRNTRYNVKIVMNGKQALDYISTLTPGNLKAILMDISTPEMDGVVATRHIRLLKGDISGIPIIALTAHVFQDEQDLFIAAGMDDYLPKPVSRKDLLSMLSRWVPQIH